MNTARNGKPAPKILAFDADDTLWANEHLFGAALAELEQILQPLMHTEEQQRLLQEIEQRNIPLYGVGVKSFILSALETLFELSGEQVDRETASRVIRLGQEMLRAPVPLKPGAVEVLELLTGKHEMWLVTLGDLMDQLEKLEKSGLRGYFDRVEILNYKDARGYRRLLERRGRQAEELLMIGNSLHSDILPVVEIGGSGVHIPSRRDWSVAGSDGPGRSDVPHLRSLLELPGWLEQNWPERFNFSAAENR